MEIFFGDTNIISICQILNGQYFLNIISEGKITNSEAIIIQH